MRTWVSRSIFFGFIVTVLNCSCHFHLNVNGETSECIPKSFGPDKIVCVCNETHCDEIGVVEVPPQDNFVIYTSCKKGLRMEKRIGKLEPPTTDNKPSEVKIVIDAKRKRQKILGFGGAFTDAAGINIRKLPLELQETLLRSYYGPEGIGYSLGRIPMGGTDFSTHPYTYDDNPGDTNLTQFSLQKEDYLYKIPFIKLARSLNKDLLLYGSPWSAPPWMKSNNDYKGRGILKEEFFQLWADYFIKFLEAYADEGITIWGITTQNEPIDGLVPLFPFNCMGWTPSSQRNWIKKNLGPTLHANGFQNLKIIILDDVSVMLPMWPNAVLSDPEVANYVSGIGLHWYSNALTKYWNINTTANLFPDKFILGTEACEGFFPWQEKVIFGSWERAETYAEDIIQDLINGVVGWTDWNIALSLTGGPNWANLGADSPIIVNDTSKEFYKQPMFYSLAHVAKFFLRHSYVINTELISGLLSSSIQSNLHVVGALRPDGAVSVVFLNKNDIDINVDLEDAERGSMNFTLKAKSIATLLYS